MRRFITVLLALILGCGFRTSAQDSFMEGLTKEDQIPQMGLLGHDGEDGIFFGFQFKARDLTEQEDFRMLAAVITRIDQLNADPDTEFQYDYENKVVIFAYEGKTIDVTATADFRTDEVELWTGYRDKDWYVKKTYKGEPADVLDYLRKGIQGKPTIEEGKKSEEPKVSLGPKPSCQLQSKDAWS